MYGESEQRNFTVMFRSLSRTLYHKYPKQKLRKWKKESDFHTIHLRNFDFGKNVIE